MRRNRSRSRESAPQPRFQRGDTVVVVKKFESDSSEVNLKVDVVGRVLRVDDDGDLKIEFKGAGTQRVLAKKFSKLDLTPS